MFQTLKILSVAFCFVWLAATAWAQEAYWQLTFSYEEEVLRLESADPIAPMRKAVRTPGLAGAPARISYDVEWLDGSDKVVKRSKAIAPVGARQVVAPDTAPAAWIPEEGAFVVRLAGPPADKSPASVRLIKTGTKGLVAKKAESLAAFAVEEWTFELPAPQARRLTDGPFGSEKVRDRGPDDNRVVLVVLSDGYTMANHTAGQFSTATAGFLDDMESASPWSEIAPALNVYRIDVESNETGADEETQGVDRDTYFNSSFWTNNIERLLAIDGTGYSRAFAAADQYAGVGVWDQIVILVNSTKYGGSGGTISVSSVHSSASEIVIHEVGHSFAGLADEYESAYPGYPAGDWEPNVDYDYQGAGLKWLVWVEQGTPLPTPEQAQYSDVVGAFEGARYQSSGIYRPWLNCKMRSLGVDFCPVCIEAHLLESYNLIDIIDDTLIDPETETELGSTPITFGVVPQGFTTLEFEWLLDGSPIGGEDGPTIDLTAAMVPIGESTLTLRITDDTEAIRKTTVSEEFEWTVTASSPSSVTSWTVY